MRVLKILYLATGIVLLLVVLAEFDVGAAFRRSVDIGWGFALVIVLYFAVFLIDSLTWQITLLGVPLGATWLYRCWKIRMAGEVFNYVLPAGGMGGEPLKAELLKRYFGIGYREGTASLIRAKTINIMALAIFLSAGFLLMLDSPALGVPYKLVAGVGLFGFVLGAVLVFLVQRFRVTSWVGAWLGRTRLGGRLDRIVAIVRDMDERLARFYTRHRVRFFWAIALSLANWIAGILEIYCTLLFLGHPVTLVEAWIIEAFAQLVRAASFLIPANIGVLEGGFALIFGEMTGSAALGLAAVVVRRAREITWLLAGLAVGSMLSLRPPLALDVRPDGTEDSADAVRRPGSD